MITGIDKKFKENKKLYGKENLILSIEKTREYIDEFYNKPIPSKMLLERLKKTEFSQKWLGNLLTATVIGIVTGLLSSIILQLGELLSSILTDNIVFNSLGFLLVLGLEIILIYGIVNISLFSCRRICLNAYIIYLAPYERQVVINKLHKDYAFNFEPNVKNVAKVKPRITKIR